jgi:hypothetical protein
VAVAFAVVAASSVEAGVKTEQKTQVQFGGLLGGIMNEFGGKSAKEGLVDTPSDPRSMLMTSSTELLKVTPDAAAADVALPAGYKLK